MFRSRCWDAAERAKTLQIVQEELQKRGWTKAELKRQRKGDEAKVALARRLREERAVSLRWIAEDLYMGTWTHVSQIGVTMPLPKEYQYLALTPFVFPLNGRVYQMGLRNNDIVVWRWSR
jgi:hypothetical protein